MSKIAAFPVLFLLCMPLLVPADTPKRQHLFKIERSKNANIVQYDAQLGADGKLLEKEPVIGYWIRLAEQGQVKELSWVQKKFAYGFRTKLNQDRESAELEMAADFARPISIVRAGGRYRATALIDGAPSYIEKIFIKASKKGMFVSVEYLELYGEDMQTGKSRYEMLVP